MTPHHQSSRSWFMGAVVRATATTMNVAVFFPFLLSVFYQSNAFSSVSRYAALHYAVNVRSRFPPPCLHSFQTSLHFAASDDSFDQIASNQTITNSTGSGNIVERNPDNEIKKGFFGNVFGRGGRKFDKASLAKLGGSVLLSYGFVSNIFGITCVSCAWYIASRKTGLSPLAPGQWKGFLAVYAAFFAFLNVIRPARFALSVYISKFFDKILNVIQNRFHCKKGAAVGILITAQVFFSFSYLFLGVLVASTLAGVPVWAGRL